MPKSLEDMLKAKAGPTAAEASATEPAKRKSDRRLIGGHFAPEVAKQLRQIAADDETTIQALLAEALDLLFHKKKRPEIASRVRGDA